MLLEVTVDAREILSVFMPEGFFMLVETLVEQFLNDFDELVVLQLLLFVKVDVPVLFLYE